MIKDIGPILDEWQHDPDEMQVRIVPGADGRDKLQTRLDLGLIQMELAGRPDGQRPLGVESLLDHYETAAGDPGFAGLETGDCVALMREGVQFYHRYLALFHLQRFDLVARDTARNLRLFAFVRAHAVHDRDKIQFDQYRPYVTMMLARARGLEALERGDHRTALGRIDEGIAGIRAFLEDYDQLVRESECQELTALVTWRAEVEQARPVGPVERLEQQLDLAVAREQFEEAARLRDRIRQLRAMVPDDRSDG